MNDGGLAFPFKCQGPTTAPEIYYGMTLRDYFAAKAMKLATEWEGSIKSVAEYLGVDLKDYKAEIHWPQFISKKSYQIADAMLVERDKKV